MDCHPGVRPRHGVGKETRITQSVTADNLSTGEESSSVPSKLFFALSVWSRFFCPRSARQGVVTVAERAWAHEAAGRV
eukprot:1457972-Heterocapsa_arctica.AAC.1